MGFLGAPTASFSGSKRALPGLTVISDFDLSMILDSEVEVSRMGAPLDP